MKVRFSSKGNIATNAFRLTPEEIEEQVLSDLTKYRKAFLEKHGIHAPTPLDVESLVKELWGVEVGYEEIPQTAGEETLGYYIPSTKTIVVDPEVCNNAKRLSFTVAHEAGHLSLHSFMFSGKTEIKGKVPFHVSIERQADTYAAHLLAPKFELFDFLREQKKMTGDTIALPIDINELLPALQSSFGLSRHAMEIHFQRLGIPMTNTRHI
jgi:Zn-dependent peptidase ImmA (M78 family)